MFLLKKLSSLLLAGVALASSSAFAAERTVALTGGDYTTIKDAVSAIDTWGDGDDTILIQDDQAHIISYTPIVLHAFNAGSLTLKNAPDASPVITYTNDFLTSETRNPQQLIAAPNSGNFTIDGLTFLGPAGLDNATEIAPSPSPSRRVRAAVIADAPTSVTINTTTIRNCIFTANDGANQPVMTWGSTVATTASQEVASRPTKGALVMAVEHGDGSFRGRLTLNIENCTIALCWPNNNGMGAVQFSRAPDTDPSPNVRADLFVRNTLFINNYEIGLRSNNKFANSGSITFENSAIFGFGKQAIRLDGGNTVTGYSAPFSATDCVFAVAVRERTAPAPAGSVKTSIVLMVSRPRGNMPITLNRVTIQDPNNDPLYVENPEGLDGLASWNFQDVIWSNSDTSWRAQGSRSPASATAQNLAMWNLGFLTTNTLNVDLQAEAAGMRPDTEDQPTGVMLNALLGVYGGAGPIQGRTAWGPAWSFANPQYLSQDFSQLDGVLGWHREDNDLYDVTNPYYEGKGTPGMRASNALAGGADYPFGVVPTRARAWSLYD